MTAPNGPILFNADSGGSDTAASGLGPSTAVSGTGGSTDGTTTVDLSADSPDLSGVSAGDALWVDSSSGRQWSIIASVDDGADTVTCDDAFSNTESSRNWGIGGKRATADNSRQLFLTDLKGAWTVEFEADESFSTAIVWEVFGTQTTGWVCIRGSSGSQKTLTVTGSGEHVFDIDDAGGGVRGRLRNLILTSSHASPGNGLDITGNQAISLVDVRIHDCFVGINRSANGPQLSLTNCEIDNNDDDGINVGSSSIHCRCHGCDIHDNGGSGLSNHGVFILTFCNIYGNTSRGVSWDQATSQGSIINCNIHDNGADGVYIHNVDNEQLILLNSNITKNGGYGINPQATYDNFWVDYCNFGTGSTANTSGDINDGGLTTSQGDNNLAVDPQFTDAANGDFSIGTNLKAAGSPGAFPSGNSTGYLDIGAAQRQEPAGGGGQAKLRRLMYIGEGVGI